MRRRALIAVGIAAVLATGVAGVASLRDDVRLKAPTPTAIVYDRDGAFITQVGHGAPGAQIDYGYWPLATLPDRVVRATLALEDRRFWTHPGVDVLAVGRALVNNLRGARRSGASTIAMQVARMQHPAGRSLLTKVREAATAVGLTMSYSREDLLGHYLQLVPYGNGSHGIAHAARFYFDKPVEDLSWAEIALLSAVPQSPTRLNPLHPEGLARAIRRGHGMLDELARQDVITPAELGLAHRQLAVLPPPRVLRRPDAMHVVLRYDALVREGNIRPVSRFDPRIHASIDLALQGQVTDIARRYQRAFREAGAEQISLMVIDRAGGGVVASLGAVDHRDRQAGWVDFTRRQRSPGSTLKPFIYALALERGVITPGDVLADLPEGASNINNADGHFLGPMLPRQALANSRNVPATNLLRSTGLDRSFRFLHDLGLHDIELPAETFGLSMAIGSLPTTLEKLMRAYSVFAEDGRMFDPVWTKEQRRRDAVRLLSVDTARLITSFLSDPMARLPSFPRYGAMEYPFPVALKTGTSQGYRDAWTIAWSKRYLVGAWVGRADAGTMTRMTGAGSAARIVHAVMMRLHGSRPGDLEDATFPPPPGRQPVELCTFGGRRSIGYCGQTLTEWLRPEEVPPAEEVPHLRAVAADEERPAMRMPAEHRAWAQAEGYRLAEEVAIPGQPKLSIVAPENNSRVWLNPETPASLTRIALKAVVEPRVPQVVWYVDGVPFAMSDPDRPVYWPASRGAHRIQLRLPLQPGVSKVMHIVVE